MEQRNSILRDKILFGIRKAQQKLFEQRAKNNDTVVISVNGVPKHVPAKDILAARSKGKGI